MNSKVYAAVLEKPYGFELKSYDKPRLNDEDILMKVELCGICGSDIHFWKGKLGTKDAKILGHEFIGRVEDAGIKALEKRGLEIGDVIAAEIVIPCYKCEWCKQGKYNLCKEDEQSLSSDYGRQFGCNIAITRPPTPLWGGFAQYLYVPPEAIVHKYPKNIDLKEAVMTEPFATALHAVNISGLKENDSCIISGPGTIGLCIVQAAKLKGAKPIILVGTEEDKHRLKIGSEMGADYCIGSDNAMSEVKQILSHGADITFDASGSINAELFSLQALKRGGKCIFVGITNGKELTFDCDKDLIFKETTIMGCILNGGYTEAVDLIKNKKVSLSHLVTHEFGLKNINEAFRFLDKKEGNVIKAVINPWKS